MTLLALYLLTAIAAPPLAEPTPMAEPDVLAPPPRRSRGVDVMPPNPPARPDGKPFTCQAYAVADAATGQILCSRNLHERLYPASTTKVMTTLVALETIELGRAGLDDVVVVSKRGANVPESGIWLSPGEHITLRDLLTAVMVRSANDAAFVVAEYLGGGDVQRFVDKMNRRARELGAAETHFINPHGLHVGLDGEPLGEQHYTSAHDLLVITLEAWRHPWFRELAAMRRCAIAWENLDPDPQKRHADQRLISNRNKLLDRYDECVGIKTGYTKQAGACLISAARRGDRAVIAVTLKSASGEDRWIESETLLRYALDEFEPRALLREGQNCGTVAVRDGAAARVDAVATGSVRLLMHRLDPTPRPDLRIIPAIWAPVPRGVPVGTALVRLPGGRVREVPLVVDRDVPVARAALTRWGLGSWLVWIIIGLVGYGAAAEAYSRRRDLLAARG